MYEYEDTPEDQAAQIELHIDEARQGIADMEALNRLRQNKDFKRIFLKLFLEDEPARLTTLLAHPSYQGDDTQADIINQLKSVSLFGQYMTKLNQFGISAQTALEDHEQELELVHSEEEV